MARPYKKLRDLLHESDITFQILAGEIGISVAALSMKMNAKPGHSWKENEMWAVMDFLHIPDNRFHEIFPRKGRNEPAMKPVGYRRAV